MELGITAEAKRQGGKEARTGPSRTVRPRLGFSGPSVFSVLKDFDFAMCLGNFAR